MGMPHRYLLRQRIARAKERPLISGDPILAIALDCGFKDAGTIWQAFPRAVGQIARQLLGRMP